jgi:transposase
MFLKTIKAGNHTYAQIVESYKENGISKHRILLNFGRVESIKEKRGIKKLIRSLSALVEGKDIKAEEIPEGVMFNYGYLPYKKLWNDLDMPNILKSLSGNIEFSLNDSVFLMAITHLLNPSSKLKAYNRKDRYLGLPDIKLHNLYRSLDILYSNKENIEDHLFSRVKDLFNLSLDVVFYDVTTFYFESVKKDSLKDFGFSKDNKLNEVQVVMGLLIDKNGMPVGYELFPGNTYEGKTLEVSLLKLKQRFNIDRIIVVADKGMNSKINLEKIKDMGFRYIISSRIKSMNKKLLEKVLSKEDFIKDKNYDYKKLDLKDKSLIVTYSEERAKNDAKKREKLIKKAVEYTSKPSLIKASNKRGGKKYIENTGECSYSLDEEAILKDSLYDGYYAVETNDLDLTPKEIISNYGMLWKIEESFRIMKSSMEVRPVFHWTEGRIKGHFMVCFLSFLLERNLEFKLKEKDIDYSPERIKEALNSMNLVEADLEGNKFVVKIKPDSLAKNIFSSLRINYPKNIPDTI